MQKFYQSLVNALRSIGVLGTLILSVSLTVAVLLIVSDIIIGTKFGVLASAARIIKISQSQVLIGGLVVYFLANKK